MNRGFRALALLLEYPDARLIEHLDEIDSAVAELGRGARTALVPLISRLRTGELIDLQEIWVETFERGRRSALSLFEHVHGDSRDRGQAMVDLLAMYESAGLVFESEQLPDYLPVFLDFLALCPAEQAREQLADIAHILDSVRAVLARRQCSYRVIFDILLDHAGVSRASNYSPELDDATPEGLDAAWAEAPVEFLGASAPTACEKSMRSGQPIRIERRTA